MNWPWRKKPAATQRVDFYQTRPVEIIIKRDAMDNALLCLALAAVLAFLLTRAIDAAKHG